MQSSFLVRLSALLLATVIPAQARPAARAPSAKELAYLRALPLPATTIADVIVNLNGVLTDIGDIEATHAPDATNTATIMSASFTLAPAHARLKNWLSFHWVQAITADACPATYAARPLAFPQLDPPLDGWDYMYAGPGRANPITAIPNFGWFLDDKPWYWNATGEGANFVPGVQYDVSDVPTHCGAGGATTFKTWLVAEGPGKTFCLIRGFGWTISSIAGNRVAATDLGAPTPAQAAEIAAALGSSQFVGWSCDAGCPFEWGYDVTASVDAAARRVAFTFKLTGPALGLGAVYAARSAVAPVPTPFGALHLDPVSLTPLALVPLNAVGYAELTVWLAADAAAGLQVATQGVVANALGARLTNYALLGAHYHNAVAWELLAATYNSATDHYRLLGRAVPSSVLDFTMQNGAGPRQALGSMTVPPLGTFAFSYGHPGFDAPGTFEAKNGARTLVRLQ